MEQRRVLEQRLRDFARKRDREMFNLLQSVPGIGPISAIGILAEIGDISRFKHVKQFAVIWSWSPGYNKVGKKNEWDRSHIGTTPIYAHC